MSEYIINGGRTLEGKLNVQGAKNSALPILAATLLVNGESVIHNCPVLSDTECTVKILKSLGCKVKREGSTLIVDSTNVNKCEIPDCLMGEMRSSIVFLGAILGRLGKASVTSPGGCEIGLRPIDLHLFAVKKLGCSVEEKNSRLNCVVKEKLKGNKISFSFPSVGATENAILASVTAIGDTTIINAAREPEIIDLCDFLNKSGAKIQGAGESVIKIQGVKKLHPTEHTVICDRIAATTFLLGAAVTKGKIELNNIQADYLNSVLPLLEESGCELKVKESSIYLNSSKRLRRIDKIVTQPYPGFPTDAQALFMTLTAVAEGTSVIVENIFESRFNHVPQLLRMGAKIKTEGRVAVVEGVEKLRSAKMFCPDLRGGAAIVLASLCAEGTSVVENIELIDRGYENFENNLCSLNCDVHRKVSLNGK